MTYGVFTLHNGAWNLVATYSRKAEAEQEIAYLRDQLGLRVGLFIKK